MNRQFPRLKNGVDLQVQSAVRDSNWAVVARLADKRARTFNDQYHEILKICAESQLEEPTAKLGPLYACRRFAKDGTIVKDAESLELLKWATQDIVSHEEHNQTLGLLLVRLAKANSGDETLVTKALKLLLLHWDLVNAQQVAAQLDRSFQKNRDFMFWNIAVTHLLSTSPETSVDKRKLYATLAHRQIERAAQVTEQAKAADSTAQDPARGIKTEEEVLLLYEIVETHGTSDDLRKLISSPLFSPTAQLELRRKEPLLRTLSNYQTTRQHQAAFDLCRDCLGQVDSNGVLTLFAVDWTVLDHFVSSAAQLSNINSSILEVVDELLQRLKEAVGQKSIYARSIQLARLKAAFLLRPADENDIADNKPSSTRLRDLTAYVDEQSHSPACFDDIRPFIEQLDPEGINFLVHYVEDQVRTAAEDQMKSRKAQLLASKLRYFALSCAKMSNSTPSEGSSKICSLCEATFTRRPCPSCLRSLIRECQTNRQEVSTAPKGKPLHYSNQEIASELSYLIASCHILLALPHEPPTSPSVLSHSAIKHLLHAYITTQADSSGPQENTPLTLLSMQLSIRLGAASNAGSSFDDLAIKRTVIDSLGPLFYDRIATISPALISPDQSDMGWNLHSLLKSHYDSSLRKPIPERFWDAVTEGSYSSVLGMPRYMMDLRRSCTRVMSLVEESRSDRMLGYRMDGFFVDTRYTETKDSIELKPVIDYGSFPRREASDCTPVHKKLRIGPDPSSIRSHLALLCEAYHHTLTYRPPTAYKHTAKTRQMDTTVVIESMDRLSTSLSNFINHAEDVSTPAESIYFQTIFLLSTWTSLSATSSKSATTGSALEHMVSAINTALETLLLTVQHSEESSHPVSKTVFAFTVLHQLSLLRDAAVATKLGAQWVLSINEQAKERDKSGSSNLPKEVVALAKTLQQHGERALAEGKGIVGELVKTTKDASFGKKVLEWLRDDEGSADDGEGVAGGNDDATMARTVSGLVKSWKQNVEGWQRVQWE